MKLRLHEHLYLLTYLCVFAATRPVILPNGIYSKTGMYMLNPPPRNEIIDDQQFDQVHEHEWLPVDPHLLVKGNPSANVEDEERQWPLNPWREERIRDYRKVDGEEGGNARVRRAENNVLVPVDLETFRKEQTASIPVLIRPQNQNFLKCREKYKNHYED